MDSIQVMTPEEVTAMRSTLVPINEDSSSNTSNGNSSAPADPSTDTGSAETIPLNKDNRPPELKLFDAFSQFSGCLKDSGESIRGDLQDPNNPAYKDPAYLEIIQKCAARSDIVNILNEVSTTRANLKPDEIKTRNEGFVLLSDCLKKKGWKIETAIDSSGLINPTTFQSADGDLNQRDLDQCLTETGINDAIENGA
ncbi:MAG: hypothetical protein F2909_00320 [Actinobacteria bacterium]|nr:hypothetical protein [Actinomycetota bacterium]MSX14677.1 hypothetical protein [Actinomycetota bacterium]MSX35765.1 hypothetical protein [Actinomycetota bacterium]MSX76419.1 hypothetical protein [Actinomycetota bacterium]MSZ70716.1 hypothetical protein [Actinomycetota bacterium]